jgi:uncharacterized protein YecE (DUF72 family)
VIGRRGKAARAATPLLSRGLSNSKILGKAPVMAKRTGRFYIGTSGYQYDHWKDVFYPADLRKRDWFAHYAEHFDTVEINNSFYRLPTKKTFRQWGDDAPRGFIYALKYSRYGTHMKRLKDPQDHVGLFMSRAQALGSHLGPVLVQLPPRWGVDAPRLDAFLKAAPRKARWAIELRDRSWLCDEVYAILRKHNTALCIHDMFPNHPWEVTAGWVYLRFHGPRTRRRAYQGRYPHQAMAATANRVQDYLRGDRDVYAFFNNDEKGRAVYNADQLKRYVKERMA